LDAAYRPAGWLTTWYGFNLFSPSSLAFDRTMAILGLFGIVNLLAGFFLLGRNHVVAWLTITPLFALCLPFIAIPVAGAFAQRSVPEILAFHRLLLAIPVGLAMVVLGSGLTRAKRTGDERLKAGNRILFSPFPIRSSPFPIVVIVLLALSITSANGPYYNRLFNVLLRPAADLAMTHVVTDLPAFQEESSKLYLPARVISTLGIRYVAYAARIVDASFALRRIQNIYPAPATPVQRVESVMLLMSEISVSKERAYLFLPPVKDLETPISISAFISQHWLPQEVALEHAVGQEMATTASKLGGREIKTAAGTCYLFGDWKVP
jgi:hypothetical protein